MTHSFNSRPKEQSGVCSKTSPDGNCWNQVPSLLFLPSVFRLCCQLCCLWLPKGQGSSQAVLCSRQSPASLHWVNSFFEVRRQMFTPDFFTQGIPDSTGQFYCLCPEVTGIGIFCLWKLLLLSSSRSKIK